MIRKYLATTVLLSLLLAPPVGQSSGVPASGNSSTADGVADSLPDAEGRDAVVNGCLGGCHDAGILDQPYSPQEWQQCVDDMIALGAYIPDEDYVPIVLYLAKNLAGNQDAP